MLPVLLSITSFSHMFEAAMLDLSKAIKGGLPILRHSL
jgi:hypothetical protein